MCLAPPVVPCKREDRKGEKQSHPCALVSPFPFIYSPRTIISIHVHVPDGGPLSAPRGPREHPPHPAGLRGTPLCGVLIARDGTGLPRNCASGFASRPRAPCAPECSHTSPSALCPTWYRAQPLGPWNPIKAPECSLLLSVPQSKGCQRLHGALMEPQTSRSSPSAL